MPQVAPFLFWPTVGGSGPTPAPGTTLLSAIRNVLLVTPGLSTLTGIYSSVSPANAAFPYAILSAVGESPEWNNSGADYSAWSDVQVTIASLDDVQGIGLRDAAYRAFTPKAGNGGLTFDDGTTDQCLPGRSWQMHQDGTGPGGKTVFLSLFVMRLYVTRQM